MSLSIEAEVRVLSELCDPLRGVGDGRDSRFGARGRARRCYGRCVVLLAVDGRAGLGRLTPTRMDQSQVGHARRELSGVISDCAIKPKDRTTANLPHSRSLYHWYRVRCASARTEGAPLAMLVSNLPYHLFRLPALPLRRDSLRGYDPRPRCHVLRPPHHRAC